MEVRSRHKARLWASLVLFVAALLVRACDVDLLQSFVPGRGRGRVARIPASVITTRLKESRTVGELLGHFKTHAARLNHRHVSATFTHLAKVADGGVRKWPRLQGKLPMIIQGALVALPNCGGRELANILWSLAKLHYNPGDAFLSAMVEEAASKLDDFKPQELANTLWALAKLEYNPGDKFLGAMVKASKAKLRWFNSQELANTLWALARSEYDPGDDFLSAWVEAAEAKLPSFTPQALANSLWAFAKLDYNPGDSFLSSLVVEATEKPARFKSMECSMSEWALGKLSFKVGKQYFSNVRCHEVEMTV